MLGGVGCFPILTFKCLSSLLSICYSTHRRCSEASFLGIILGSPSWILIACQVFYTTSITPFLYTELKTRLKENNSRKWFTWVVDDCHVLNHFSQPVSLLGCRWFHSNPSTIHRQAPIIRPKLLRRSTRRICKNPQKQASRLQALAGCDSWISSSNLNF